MPANDRRSQHTMTNGTDPALTPFIGYGPRILVVASILACLPEHHPLHRIASWKLATTKSRILVVASIPAWGPEQLSAASATSANSPWVSMTGAPTTLTDKPLRGEGFHD